MASILKNLFGLNERKGGADADNTASSGKSSKTYGDTNLTSCAKSNSSMQSVEVFDIGALPEELFIYVLSWVPAVDVVKRCSLVSKHWLTVSRDCTLWRIKYEREGIYVPSVLSPLPDNFMVYYFKRPYTRNLLRNPYALEGLNYWVKPSGLTRPVAEDSPAGADPIADYVTVKGAVKNWVTSYRFGCMSQSVDLLKEGCSVDVLDKMRPSIHVSVWCAARWDCGSKFLFTVQLLDKRSKELHKFEVEKDLRPDYLRRTWHLVEHFFSDYKAGVRYVTVRMGGVDTQFWAGNYGSKFTCPSVCFAFDPK
ncbi:hypothetical protein BaRGS_00037924 [Batillaria attramentaria]|uniref:F-box protein n=1 Tax=Batillaria attramentaria TaxID=370345 RepID=A0ABD0J794_9CAEN